MRSLAAVQEAFKLALSMVLMYWLALWQNWDMPGNGGLAIALVSMGNAGASFNKGLLRLAGTSVGLTVGFIGINLFGQSPGGFMVAAFFYIVAIGYLMQSTSSSYAWFVAGFLPFMVWTSSYMSPEMDTAVFRYGSFRYLETTTGILIYTIVSVLIWPKRAVDQLRPQGATVWAGIRSWFGMCCRGIKGDSNQEEASELRIKMAGALAAMMESQRASYSDSSRIRFDKEVWETMRINLRGLSDGLDLWYESVRDCEGLDLKSRLKGLDDCLDGFDMRLERMVELWQGGGLASDEDEDLLKPLLLGWADAGRKGCSHGEVAVVANFLLQWKLLDQLAVESLRAVRVIAGLDSKQDVRPRSLVPDRVRRVLWDPQRLLRALFPACCFLVGYAFWVFTDPPSGPSIPGTVVALSLNSVLSRVNAKSMLMIHLLGLWVSIAPVYMWIMPALDTGGELLAMIFIYTFVYGWLGSINPVLKLIPLIMLTSMAGISNQQSYSFMSLVVAAQMFLYCLTVIAMVDMLWSSSQPQHMVVGGMRRFFKGCSQIVEGFKPGRGQVGRKRHFDSKLTGVPASIQAAAAQLNPKNFPGCDAKNVKELVSGLESISLRLQAVALAHHQLDSTGRKGRLGQAGTEIRELLQQRLASMSALEPVEEPVSDRELKRISDKVEARLEASDDEHPAAYYALLGSARGLVEAIKVTRAVMSRIDWATLEKARF